jgi:osmoprotectant transport system permease protein
VVAALAVPGCGSGREAPVVHIGSKAFTESVILGDILAGLVEHAGVRAEHSSPGGRRLGDTGKVWQALLADDLQAYCEYTGTLTQEILVGENLKSDDDLARALAERGLKMSASVGFSNGYALGMKEEKARRLGIRTLSDLRKHPDLRLGLSNAFIKRADGWEGLKARYGLPFRSPDGMEHTLAYKGLETDSLDVIDLYTTDAEILRYNLRVLEDDRRYFPNYDAVILYRADLAERSPKALAAILQLQGKITARTMQELNARANIDKQPEEKVAEAFLGEHLGIHVEARVQGLTGRLLFRTKQHLTLVLVSLALGIAAAVPLGILAARRPVTGQAILGLVGVAQTIPALALLSLLIIVFGWFSQAMPATARALGLRATGAWPAVMALFIYSLLPIVRNTYTGLHDVPLQVRESAAALGLTAWARLRLVELPMASRAILAGIKTAAVINVGFATLGGLIGAGGYGDAIVAGLQRDDYKLIAEGALPAMLMALAMQGLFELAERFLVPRGLRLRSEAS